MYSRTNTKTITSLLTLVVVIAAVFVIVPASLSDDSSAESITRNVVFDPNGGVSKKTVDDEGGRC